MKNESNMAFIEAAAWDRVNPAMFPIDVPYGCKSVYRYQQPVVCKSLESLPKDTIYMSFDGWGIVTIQCDYIMTPQEKENRQTALKKKECTIVGNMRLTSQTFSRETNVSMDKLGEMLELKE